MSLPRCACGIALREFIATMSPSSSSSLAPVVRHFVSCPNQCGFQWQNPLLRMESAASFSTSIPSLTDSKPDTLYTAQDDEISESSIRKRRKVSDNSVDMFQPPVENSLSPEKKTLMSSNSVSHSSSSLRDVTSNNSNRHKVNSSAIEVNLPSNVISNESYLGLDSQLTQPLEQLLAPTDLPPDDICSKGSVRSTPRHVNKSPSFTYAEDPLLMKLRRSLFVFTDGSCPKNRNVSQLANNPAGWAYLALRPSHKFLQELHSFQSTLATAWTPDMRAKLLQWNKETLSRFVTEFLRDETTADVVDRCFGPVFLRGNAETDDFTLGASLGSNNTAELSAFLEAILYLLNHCSLLEPTRSYVERSYRAIESDAVDDPVERVVFCYDSEYAAKSLTGEFNGNKNKELILQGRHLLQQLRLKIQSLPLSNLPSNPVSNSKFGNNNSSQSSLQISPALLDRFMTTNSFSRPRYVPSSTSSAIDTGITMVHVRGHSGHGWNEAADQLALLGARGYIMRNSRFAALRTKRIGPYDLVESADEVLARHLI